MSTNSKEPILCAWCGKPITGNMVCHRREYICQECHFSGRKQIEKDRRFWKGVKNAGRI